ncbi:MAG TPA: hypothetical protein VFI65_01975 [Streptosporangiaceae bacterium]|nr:hypothetical protein [Streptosporangiaceae bacterium]
MSLEIAQQKASRTTAGRLHRDRRVLLMHLGGTPAVHAWADRFWQTIPPPRAVRS